MTFETEFPSLIGKDRSCYGCGEGYHDHKGGIINAPCRWCTEHIMGTETLPEECHQKSAVSVSLLMEHCLDKQHVLLTLMALKQLAKQGHNMELAIEIVIGELSL